MVELTKREQVLALARRGRTNKEIGYDLGIAHSTVRVLMGRICEKHAARGREDLLEALSRQLALPSVA